MDLFYKVVGPLRSVSRLSSSIAAEGCLLASGTTVATVRKLWAIASSAASLWLQFISTERDDSGASNGHSVTAKFAAVVRRRLRVCLALPVAEP